MTARRAVRPRMLCTLRGVRLTTHPRNPEAAGGRIVPWSQVTLLNESLTCFDESGVRIVRVPLPADQRRTARRAHDRWWTRAGDTRSIDVTERSSAVVSMADRVVVTIIGGGCAVVLAGMAAHEWMTLAKPWSNPWVWMVTVAALGAVVFAVARLRVLWTINVRVARVHPGGVDVVMPGGRRVAVAWSDVRRVGLGAFSIMGVATSTVGDLRFGARRTARALRAYRPHDFPAPMPMVRQLKRVGVLLAIGGVIIAGAALGTGSTVWTAVAGALALPVMLALEVGLAWCCVWFEQRRDARHVALRHARRPVAPE